jgi:hypothetical protein
VKLNIFCDLDWQSSHPKCLLEDGACGEPGLSGRFSMVGTVYVRVRVPVSNMAAVADDKRAAVAESLNTSAELVSSLQQFAWALKFALDHRDRVKTEYSVADVQKSIRKSMALLENLQRHVEKCVLLSKNSTATPSDLALAEAALSRAVAQTKKIFDRLKQSSPLGPEMTPTYLTRDELRKEMLRLETQAIEHHTAMHSHRAEDGECLLRVVQRLRQTEETMDFHGSIFLDRSKLVVSRSGSGGESVFTNDNFAYGSTPFSTFATLFSHEAVLAPIIQTAKQSGETFAVFGSSCGWLVFYAALGFGLKSVGYEILPSLVKIAEDTVREECISADVSFVCDDMLQAPLDSVAMVMLCSQCWDEWLVDTVHAKLLCEMKSGSVIIDYNGRLGKYVVAQDGGDATSTRGVELLLSIALPVSWSPIQAFHVYRIL